MKTAIKIGDSVRHTRFLNINSPQGITVLEIEEPRAFCEYRDGFGRIKTSWFILKDLVLSIPENALTED